MGKNAQRRRSAKDQARFDALLVQVMRAASEGSDVVVLPNGMQGRVTPQAFQTVIVTLIDAGYFTVEEAATAMREHGAVAAVGLASSLWPREFREAATKWLAALATPNPEAETPPTTEMESSPMQDDRSTKDWPPAPWTEAWITEVFSYHAPSNEQAVAFEAIRTGAQEFVKVLFEYAPACADRTTALRKVREAVMVANAAVALKGLV